MFGVGVHILGIEHNRKLKFSKLKLFLFPRALAFDFCYGLDLCSQGQAVRAFSGWVFP